MNAAPTAAPEFRMAIQIDKKILLKILPKANFENDTCANCDERVLFHGEFSRILGRIFGRISDRIFFNWTVQSSEMSSLINVLEAAPQRRPLRRRESLS